MTPLPQVAQHARYGCGIACLISALEFFDKPTPSEVSLCTHLAVDPGIGAEPSAIIAGAERYGLTGVARIGADLAELQRQRTAGALVIVLIQGLDSSAAGDDEGHYVALDEVDGADVVLMDPTSETETRVPIAEFQKRWHGLWEEGERVTGGAIVIRPANRKKDSVMSDRVHRQDLPQSFRVDGEREDVAALSAAEIKAQLEQLPPTQTAVIHGPHGAVEISVPTPFATSSQKPEVSAEAAREAFEASRTGAYRPPVRRDHRAPRTPRAARSR